MVTGDLNCADNFFSSAAIDSDVFVSLENGVLGSVINWLF